MEIGPNITSVLVQLITLVGVIVTAVVGYINRKGIEAIKDGITTRANLAQAAQKDAEIAVSQLAGRVSEIQKQALKTTAIHAVEIDQAKQEGRAQGMKDQKYIQDSGNMPLD